jgi:serine/threonine-protein kinase
MLAPGTVLLDRYRIVSLLGQGGMGAVYRAWDIRLEVPVALKEMTVQPGLAAHILAQLRQQFHQEAKVLARLNHPHLVRVTDFFEQAGNAYLVMDFVEGENLSDIIEQRGALPEHKVIGWGNQLLHALDYCHSEGVIHRDVKPQNVIIHPSGQAVLVDFGLMKLWDPNDPRTKTAMQGMGTPEYAPPEQYSAQPWNTDARSDLFSLGATLYHALTGQAPLTATDRMADPDHFVPVRRLNSRVSSQTEAVILQAMELQRSQRFETAMEMAAALTGQAPAGKRWRRSKRQRTKVMPGATPVAPRRRRRGCAWTIGVLLLLSALLLSGGTLWWMAQQGQGPLVALLTPTPTLTPSPTPTSTPTDAPTLTPTPSPVPPTFTPTPTLRPHPTETPTPTLTPTPDNRATVIQGAGIFAAPNAGSQVMGGVSAGDIVLVLGRSSYGEWFYIQDEEGTEGFIYARRLEWERDFESLPIIESTAGSSSSPPIYTGGYPGLTLDIWPLGGHCQHGVSYTQVYMEAHGGNGVYTYYWQNERKCGPVVNQSCTFDVNTGAGAVPGTGKVISGDGQEIAKGLYVSPISCD